MLNANANAIFRKTEAGVAEVGARALGLRAELRRLLILIDGTATLTRLAAFVRGSEINYLIAELEIQGLITSAAIGQSMAITSNAATTRPAAAQSATAAPVAIAATVAIAAVHSDTDGVLEPTAAQVLAVRRTAVRTLHDILGPEADALALKIDQCKSAQELRVTVTEVRQSLDRQMGVAVGQRFLDAVRGAAAEGTR